MKNRFKLTTGFLVISAVIFGVAAVVITQSARRTEESNLVRVVSEQSSRDAQVIASVVTGLAIASDGTETGFAAPPELPFDSGSLAMSTFLQSSNIVRLSLYGTDGSVLWSSAGDGLILTSNRAAFESSVDGNIVTGLNKNVEFVSLSGKRGIGDVTSTFIPLLDASNGEPAQILEVARDVTGTLDSRIETARTSMFQTVFGTLGGAFAILFGVVLTADILISRSRARAVLQERVLADERMVAHRLEVENQQLRQLNEERDRFLSMVSHELRTPLTAIMGFTDVLRRRQGGDAKERNEKHLELMRRNGEHLNSLIEEMLEITRIEAGSFEVTKGAFLLDELLDQVRISAEIMFGGRKQRLFIKNETADIEVDGDRKRIMQVMLNLLSNASKYSPVGSTVTLSTRLEGASIKITVADEGDGIPVAEQRLLFERFYRRDDQVTRSQSGLGLGLTIVKAIADAHQGTVSLSSKPGAGTVLTVTIPGARKSDLANPAGVLSRSELEREVERLQGVRDPRHYGRPAQAS